MKFINGYNYKSTAPLVLVLLVLLINPKLNSQLSFTINSATGNYSITCSYSSVTLTANTNYTVTPVGYTWTNPQLLSVNGSSITALTSGVYTVVAQAGSVTSSQTLSIGVNTIVPSITISSTGSLISCASQTVQMSATSNATSPGYLWNPPLFMPTGSTYIAYMPGTYTVSVKDNGNGCVNSATFSIGENRIYPNIAATVINTVACPNGTVILSPSIIGSTTNLNYAWLSPSAATVSSANSASLITNSAGIYTLTVTNTLTGCGTLAQFTVYACVGFDHEQALDLFNLFPNPTRNEISLVSTVPLHNASVSITNVLGKEVKTFVLSSSQKIDLSELSNGVYFLVIKKATGELLYQTKVIKQE